MKNRILKTIALAVLALGITVGGASMASAHASQITGTSVCQNDGTYTVTWKVANDFNSPETVSYVSKVGGGTIAGLPANIAASPSTPYKFASVTQSGIAGNAHNAGLTVHGVWGDGYSQNDSGSVNLAGNCTPVVTTTTTTIPPTTTTTTVPPTTTTLPTTTTTVPVTTTTTTVPVTTTTVPVTVPETTVPAETTTTAPPVVTTTEPPTTVVLGTAPVPPTTAPFVPVAPEVLQVIELPATGVNLGALALFAAMLIVVGAILLFTRKGRDSEDPIV